jgi:UDP-glucose 4,6-dehydratase
MEDPMDEAGPAEDYVPQNILVTGGAGFIASHVTIRLLQRYPHYKVRQGSGPAVAPDSY